MRTVDELRVDFDLYFREMEACLQHGRYWALLHMLLAMPDICASLEDPDEPVGKRYVRWCGENMPADARVTPGDRYQMRNAVLHQGTSLPPNRAKNKAEQSQYRAFSFVDPQNFQARIHQTVSGESSDILNIDVTSLAQDTRQAMENWFGRLQSEPVRMSAVEVNRPSLARVKPKVAQFQMPGPMGRVIFIEKRGITTSST